MGQGRHDILHQYILTAPSAQNAVDIFAGEWSSAVPSVEGTGNSPLFSDDRITWAVAEFGGIEGKTVLELGPLEAGHTSMLEAAGAADIVAIEANTRAYLKCLVVKEIMGLRRARFLCGDFLEYLRSGTTRFDVGTASGVLYHMQSPIELLALLARSCDQLFLWTHYFDANILAELPYMAEKFVGAEWVTVEGFPHTLHHYAYGDALNWTGFCAGGANAAWLERNDILAALHFLGMEDIRINLDHVHHPNGPSFALVARRASRPTRTSSVRPPT